MDFDYHSLLNIAFRSSVVYIFMVASFRIFGKRELSQLSKPIRNLIQSEPVTLIYNGKILDKNLKDVLLTDDELLAAVREHGVSAIQDVSLAVMEVDGNISVISEDGNQFKRTQYKRKRHHKSLQDI